AGLFFRKSRTIASLAWRCSAGNSAAPTEPHGSSASSAPSHRPSADKREKRKPAKISITVTLRSARRGRQSIVEVLRLAVNILGAGIGAGVAGEQLLGSGGLLHCVFFLAVG